MFCAVETLMTKLTCLAPYKKYKVFYDIDLLSLLNFRALSFLFLDYLTLAYRHTNVPLDLTLKVQEAKN